MLLAAPAKSETVRTLADAYKLARQNLETVAISEQSLRQAEALYRRAIGFSLPEASLRSATDISDPREQALTDVFFRVGYSGFNGYREWAQIKQGKAGAAAAEAQLRRAEQLVLSDVAAAFFGILQSDEDVKATQELQVLAGKRLSELRERVRVGRTREADSLAQEVQSTALASQLEESARQSASRTDLLLYLTRAEAAQPATSDAQADLPPKPLESYLARIDNRPDVEASRRAVDAARASVHLARADRLPQVGYALDYFVSRPRVDRDSDWRASVTAAFPIFSFGARAANEAASKAASAAQELTLSQTRRNAELEVRDSWRNLSVAKRQLELSTKALKLAERDYSLQRRDESRGLVTALEVLESLNRLNQARLQHNQSLLGVRLASVNLELAAGAKPEEIDLR